MKIKRKRKLYKVRWLCVDGRIPASMDIMAVSDHSAKQRADKVGKDLGVVGLTRFIWQGNRLVK